MKSRLEKSRLFKGNRRKMDHCNLDVWRVDYQINCNGEGIEKISEKQLFL